MKELSYMGQSWQPGETGIKVEGGMKFRPQRGTLADAMAECVELEPTMTALRAHLRKIFNVKPEEAIMVKPYGRDERIGWDSHIVTVENFGVAGFTDAQPDR